MSDDPVVPVSLASTYYIRNASDGKYLSFASNNSAVGLFSLEDDTRSNVKKWTVTDPVVPGSQGVTISADGRFLKVESFRAILWRCRPSCRPLPTTPYPSPPINHLTSIHWSNSTRPPLPNSTLLSPTQGTNPQSSLRPSKPARFKHTSSTHQAAICLSNTLLTSCGTSSTAPRLRCTHLMLSTINALEADATTDPHSSTAPFSLAPSPCNLLSDPASGALSRRSGSRAY